MFNEEPNVKAGAVVGAAVPLKESLAVTGAEPNANEGVALVASLLAVVAPNVNELAGVVVVAEVVLPESLLPKAAKEKELAGAEKPVVLLVSLFAEAAPNENAGAGVVVEAPVLIAKPLPGVEVPVGPLLAPNPPNEKLGADAAAVLAEVSFVAADVVVGAPKEKPDAGAVVALVVSLFAAEAPNAKDNWGGAVVAVSLAAALVSLLASTAVVVAVVGGAPKEGAPKEKTGADAGAARLASGSLAATEEAEEAVSVSLAVGAGAPKENAGNEGAVGAAGAVVAVAVSLFAVAVKDPNVKAGADGVVVVVEVPAVLGADVVEAVEVSLLAVLAPKEKVVAGTVAGAAVVLAVVSLVS